MQKQQEKAMSRHSGRRMQGPCAMEFVAGNTGSWRLERPVVDHEVCVKCGICAMYCPANVIDADKERTEGVTIDMGYCKGCGICANECPKGAILMVDERSAR